MVQVETKTRDCVTITPDNSQYVAYFCMEFGVKPELPIYSGGLGILAGDMLKAANDEGFPIIGAGLLYRRGYFNQKIRPDGWQAEGYPIINPYKAGLKKIVDKEGNPVTVTIPIEDRTVAIQAYLMPVGTTPLVLLTTDVEGNSKDLRQVTDHLYGAQFNGDTQTRLRQEMVLGIGGYKMLEKLGIPVGIWHMNEGHSAFLTIARILPLIQQGLSLEQALEQTRSNQLFTCHTPVQAGHDIFPDDLLMRAFSGYQHLFNGEFPKIKSLANFFGNWSQSHLARACAGETTAVSMANAEIMARMWQRDKVPYVTNGVHISWLDNEIRNLIDPNRERFTKYHTNPDYLHERMTGVDYEQMRVSRNKKRGELVKSANRHSEYARLDPDTLTIGIARRAATYKRLCLLSQDPVRLLPFIEDTERPVQIIMAAKAHPHDDGGKEMIRRLVNLSQDPKFRRRVVFITNYNSFFAKEMVVGSDVWLNVPEQDAEASGTSGMKSSMNGGVQWSTWSGWYREIPDGLYFKIEDDYSHAVVAERMYDMLANTIMPRFYNDGRPFSEAWAIHSLATMKHTIVNFSAARMLKDYQDRCYRPILNKQLCASS